MKATIYQIYNESTSKVHYETESKDLLLRWLELNTISFLAKEYDYFPAAGQKYTVIDKENDFDITEEIITTYFND